MAGCKLGRPRNGLKGRRRTKYDYRQLVGKQVRFPATYFGVDEPGTAYNGKIVRKDPTRSGYVILSLEGDSTKYFARFQVSRRRICLQMPATACQSVLWQCGID